ncbi:FTR1 family protein [Cohnella sp. GCM10020058]|uniref:FTR1 family iron permease n=1 Tax=Cohnella sp. GCM10020058 TaxID=3317330 RepID=UPI00362A10BE
MLIWTIAPFAPLFAATDSTHAADASLQTEALVSHLDAGNAEAAAQDLAAIKKWWAKGKNDVKQRSLDLALEIDGQIAALSLAMLSGKMDEASSQAGNLRFSVINLQDGAYADNSGKSQMTLSTYILKLREAGNLANKQDWEAAGQRVKQLQQQWLSVEGDVVSQSQRVYNDTERDLVMLDGYLSNADQRALAAPVIDRLIEGLAPLADAKYSWWDAALIPIREGLEGLLVVGALLMYAKRAGSKPARRWVVGGSVTGLLASIAAGFAVVLLLSSSAFGHNNLLINGWTGVCASAMLLYVSYWLHRHSDTKRFNRLLAERSTRALSGGHMFSLALLSFFAIVREGLETVIFLIGMSGKMSAAELVAGIAAGFLVLAAVAFVIVKAGSRLPLRPFFLGSSLIVFYLCFKFMGSGIHSLQMAGVLPSTVNEALPDFSTLSLYPSWYSTLPQLVFLACGCIAVIWSMVRSRRRREVLS